MKKERATRRYRTTSHVESVEIVACTDESYDHEIQSQRLQEIVNKMISRGRFEIREASMNRKKTKKLATSS